MAQGSYLIEALGRGLDVLSLFSRERPTLSLTQITDAARLNKTTAFRILSTLEAAGYLERDSETKKYRPGLKVLKLGFTAISSLEFRQVARPYLEHLSQQVGETVSLSVLDGMEVVYVDRIRNQQIVGVILGLGSRIPAHCGSMGKSILAYLPADELARRLEQVVLRPCTPYSQATPQALMTELAQIRRQGYALNIEELEIGLLAVAAPIFDHQQQVVAAINVAGSSRNISRERLVDELAPLVRSTAGQISQALGYSGED
jgi:PcaR/PcaU/PobR family beta-ketoadipate pathway transcriptional regulator